MAGDELQRLVSLHHTAMERAVETFIQKYERMMNAPPPREHIARQARLYKELVTSGEPLEVLAPAQLEIVTLYHDAVWETFMSSQGRQNVQPQLLDSTWRMLTEQGFKHDWSLLTGPQSRHLFRQRRIPHGHLSILPEQQAALFEFWMQMAGWIGRYQETGDASQLPTHQEVTWFMHEHLEQSSAGSSSTFEEISSINAVLDMYREYDAEASLTSDESILLFSLPAIVRGDLHWVSNPKRKGNQAGRGRYHTLDRRANGTQDQHHSGIQVLLVPAGEKRDKGEPLTLVERLYVRMVDWLEYIGGLEGAYERNLPEYARLIRDYKEVHPKERVEVLHRRIPRAALAGAEQ